MGRSWRRKEERCGRRDVEKRLRKEKKGEDQSGRNKGKNFIKEAHRWNKLKDTRRIEVR